VNYSKIIGIDLSLTSTGVCTYNEGVYNTFAIKTKLKGHLRYDHILSTIQEVLSDLEPEIAFIEGASYNSKSSSLDWIYGLSMLVRHNLCYRLGIPYKLIPPATLKKWATGKGNATKEKMIETCNENYGTSFTLKDNDMCDAYLLVRWGLNNAT